MPTKGQKRTTATCALKRCRTQRPQSLRTGREVLICAPVDFSETGRLFLDWARSPLRTGVPRPEAQVGIAHPPTEHRDRGVPRNRGTQHIDVWCRAHDSAAQRHPVRATVEPDGARWEFPLGGLGLRSHAYRGADHRCDRKLFERLPCYPPWLAPASGGLINKTGRIEVVQPNIAPARGQLAVGFAVSHTIPRLRLVGRTSASGH